MCSGVVHIGITISSCYSAVHYTNHHTAWCKSHYNDVIMGAIASQITSLTVVYSIVYSDADQRKHQSSAPLAFVRGFHRGPVNLPHKWRVMRKMFPIDDVIMSYGIARIMEPTAAKGWSHFYCIISPILEPVNLGAKMLVSFCHWTASSASKFQKNQTILNLSRGFDISRDYAVNRPTAQRINAVRQQTFTRTNVDQNVAWPEHVFGTLRLKTTTDTELISWYYKTDLTHLPLVPHICVSESGRQ